MLRRDVDHWAILEPHLIIGERPELLEELAAHCPPVSAITEPDVGPDPGHQVIKSARGVLRACAEQQFV